MKVVLAWVLSFGIAFSGGLMAFADTDLPMALPTMDLALSSEMETDDQVGVVHHQPASDFSHSDTASCSMACLGIPSERLSSSSPGFAVSQSVPMPSDVLAGLQASPPQRPPRG